MSYESINLEIEEKNEKKYIHAIYRLEHIQATTVQLQDKYGNFSVSAFYCPPKHKITSAQYDNYLKSLGNGFIAAGDLNAKHTDMGSRLTTVKGKNLLQAMRINNCKHLTYWPTDVKKNS